MPFKGQQVGTRSKRKQFLAQLAQMGPGDMCVPWPWSTVRHTYVMVNYDGKSTTAHRWVYEQLNGPVEAGLDVCHACDNPPCVRPSHLWVGTHGDNMRGAYRKGRKKATRHAPPGEAHPMAKLTAIDVERIRALYAKGGVSHRQLGEVFGVSGTQIGLIVRGMRWKS